MARRLPILACIVALSLTAREAGAAGDHASGEKLARSLCAPCHNITRTKQALDAAIPSFPALAARPGTTEQSVATLVQGPHNSSLNLPPDKAADIAAYLVSLRQ